MAPKYKLIYFNVAGRAEPIRYIFAYAGQEYEDYRVKKEEWPTIKANTPFGKVPVLEVDGTPIAQSVAIARYLAKQFGLLGSNDFEALQADSLVETLSDYIQTYYRLFREENPEKQAEVKKELSEYLQKFEKIVAGNSSGLLVGSKITWADLTFAAVLSGVQERHADALKPYPALSALVDKINSLPSIKAWLAKRPKSDPTPTVKPPSKN